MSVESGPGWAKFTSTDEPKDVERKMRDAFSPLRAMREGMARAFDDNHRWRNPHTGQFVRRSR